MWACAGAAMAGEGVPRYPALDSLRLADASHMEEHTA
jgi:hypothetical protein